MECRICNKAKSPYKFDTHELGIDWGKAKECRACYEVARYEKRKRVHKKNKLEKLKEQEKRKQIKRLTRDPDARCGKCNKRHIGRCGQSDWEGDGAGGSVYTPHNWHFPAR